MISYLRPTPFFTIGALLLSAPAFAQEPASPSKAPEGSWFPSETKNGAATPEADKDEADEADEPEAKPAPKPAPPARPAPPPKTQAKPAAAKPPAGPARPPRPKGKFGVYLGGSGVSGKLNEVRTLRSEVDSAFVFGADAYFFTSPNFAFGGYLEVGNVSREGDCPSGSIDGCKDKTFRAGVSMQYHFRPAQKGVDPWFGVGAGVTTLTFNDQSYNGSGREITYAGIDVLNLQAGVDFAIDRVFGIGPYIAFNNGVYTNAVLPTENDPHGRVRYGISGRGDRIDSGGDVSTAFHTWTTVGVRARFNFFLTPSSGATLPAIGDFDPIAGQVTVSM